MAPPYRALISSDWNECLAPCGPFDAIAFSFPSLSEELESLFCRYTGNEISLGQAAQRILSLLPAPMTEARMDAYLEARFRTYPGVVSLMRWCADRRILFMINTTGAIGYFQRVFSRGLLQTVPVLSAHPMLRMPSKKTDPEWILPLRETTDKGEHTETVARSFGIAPQKVIVMGDSGGDGPHFLWAAQTGATTIGSMTKPSLENYCREKGIVIDHLFPSREGLREREPDFMALAPIIEARLTP